MTALEVLLTRDNDMRVVFDDTKTITEIHYEILYNMEVHWLRWCLEIICVSHDITRGVTILTVAHKVVRRPCMVENTVGGQLTLKYLLTLSFCLLCTCYCKFLTENIYV